MNDDFHKDGILVQLWWLPLGVEDGEGRWESHKYIVSKVAQEHPDWLILDKNGKHARITRNLAAMCPAVPEVRAYHKMLTEKLSASGDSTAANWTISIASLLVTTPRIITSRRKIP